MQNKIFTKKWNINNSNIKFSFPNIIIRIIFWIFRVFLRVIVWTFVDLIFVKGKNI